MLTETIMDLLGAGYEIRFEPGRTGKPWVIRVLSDKATASNLLIPLELDTVRDPESIMVYKINALRHSLDAKRQSNAH